MGNSNFKLQWAMNAALKNLVATGEQSITFRKQNPLQALGPWQRGIGGAAAPGLPSVTPPARGGNGGASNSVFQEHSRLAQ